MRRRLRIPINTISTLEDETQNVVSKWRESNTQ
jgi:hypothetical protein